MSFSNDVKAEILESARRQRNRQAQAYGLFLCAKNFSENAVMIATENADVIRLFVRNLQDFIGKRVRIAFDEKIQSGRRVYSARLQEPRDCYKLLSAFGHSDGAINAALLTEPAQVNAFLSGAYLACGNITDPQKGYHVEFVLRDKQVCGDFTAILDACLPGVRRTVRRGAHVLYYKEFAQIEDLLTLMGASKACLAMIDIEMIKSVRNQANRATNCETANIDKMVDAATAQIEDIRLVFDNLGEESLPEQLRAAAELRLHNPDLSLRELAEISDPKVSRSGLYHRLSRLSRIAGEIRGQ